MKQPIDIPKILAELAKLAEDIPKIIKDCGGAVVKVEVDDFKECLDVLMAIVEVAKDIIETIYDFKHLPAKFSKLLALIQKAMEVCKNLKTDETDTDWAKCISDLRDFAMSLYNLVNDITAPKPDMGKIIDDLAAVAKDIPKILSDCQQGKIYQVEPDELRINNDCWEILGQIKDAAIDILKNIWDVYNIVPRLQKLHQLLEKALEVCKKQSFPMMAEPELSLLPTEGSCLVDVMGLMAPIQEIMEEFKKPQPDINAILGAATKALDMIPNILTDCENEHYIPPGPWDHCYKDVRAFIVSDVFELVKVVTAKPLDIFKAIILAQKIITDAPLVLQKCLAK